MPQGFLEVKGEIAISAKVASLPDFIACFALQICVDIVPENEAGKRPYDYLLNVSSKNLAALNSFAFRLCCLFFRRFTAAAASAVGAARGAVEHAQSHTKEDLQAGRRVLPLRLLPPAKSGSLLFDLTTLLRRLLLLLARQTCCTSSVVSRCDVSQLRDQCSTISFLPRVSSLLVCAE